jgi:hypothetical protein
MESAGEITEMKLERVEIIRTIAEARVGISALSDEPRAWRSPDALHSKRDSDLYSHTLRAREGFRHPSRIRLPLEPQPKPQLRGAGEIS